MRIDAVASYQHYADHIAPVWRRLPNRVKGVFYVSGRVRLPFETRHMKYFDSRRSRVVIAASYMDLRRCGDASVVLMEHGAGQSYGGDPVSARHVAYAGGVGRDSVRLFLCPNRHSADRNRRFYPDAQTCVVGSPRLVELQSIRQLHYGNTVGFVFHWDCQVCPETRTGWQHFYTAIRHVADAGYKVLVHAHPRIFADIAPAAASMGGEPEPDFERIVALCDVLMGDNTSALFEFAFLRGSVVVLNPPWYRKHVDHGLRFWECADVGPQIDHPGDVVDAVRTVLQSGWVSCSVDTVFPSVEDPAGVAVEHILDMVS